MNTPQIQMGGGLLKTEPKGPPVQNKCLATCKDIKDSCTHSFWHQSILQVLYVCRLSSKLLYRAQYKTGSESTTLGSEPQESGPPAHLQKQRATVSLFGILPNCFFSPASLSDCVCSELLFVCCFQCFSLASVVEFCTRSLPWTLLLPHRVLSLSFFR